MADAQKKRRIPCKPNAMQRELLERMFTGGPILNSEVKKLRGASLAMLGLVTQGFVDEGCDRFPWRLTAEGNYYMGGNYEADYSDSEDNDDDR